MRGRVCVYSATLSMRQIEWYKLTDKTTAKQAASPGYSTICFILGYIYWQIGEVIVCEQRPDTVSSVCPPPLSPVSDFVFLAICSHCAALPDGRHSVRLGSVNCKGMWHSILNLRMFLWFSRVHDGKLYYYYCHYYFVYHGVEQKTCFSVCTNVLARLPKIHIILNSFWISFKNVFFFHCFRKFVM